MVNGQFEHVVVVINSCSTPQNYHQTSREHTIDANSSNKFLFHTTRLPPNPRFQQLIKVPAVDKNGNMALLQPFYIPGIILSLFIHPLLRPRQQHDMVICINACVTAPWIHVQNNNISSDFARLGGGPHSCAKQRQVRLTGFSADRDAWKKKNDNITLIYYLRSSSYKAASGHLGCHVDIYIWPLVDSRPCDEWIDKQLVFLHAVLCGGNPLISFRA